MSNQINQEVESQEANTSVGAVGENSVGVTTSIGEASNVELSNPSFLEQIPEEFRDEASLTNIKDLSGLVKGYVHAQKEIGSRIRIPGPDASPEIKAEFNKKLEAAGYSRTPNLNDSQEKEQLFNKLGRPDTVEGYDTPIPEELGAIVNKEHLQSYKELAHKIGLTKEQAKALLQFDVDRTVGQMENSSEIAKETLKGEWGDAFDSRLNLAKEGLKYFESKYPDAVSAIRQGPSGNNPVVLMMAAELGKVYKEAGIVVGNRSVSYGLTPGEARARINEVIGNQSHAYHNDSDPKHLAAVEEVETLYRAAYPDKG